VSTEKIAKRDITEIVTASGKIYPEKEVKISPDISGEIVELMVFQEGDSVKKGQELARIYGDIYGTQRDQAAAQVNQQQALVSNISAQLPGLKATLDANQRTFDRQKQLLDQKVISLSEYEAAENALKSARQIMPQPSDGQGEPGWGGQRPRLTCPSPPKISAAPP